MSKASNISKVSKGSRKSKTINAKQSSRSSWKLPILEMPKKEDKKRSVSACIAATGTPLDKKESVPSSKE